MKARGFDNFIAVHAAASYPDGLGIRGYSMHATKRTWAHAWALHLVQVRRWWARYQYCAIIGVSRSEPHTSDHGVNRDFSVYIYVYICIIYISVVRHSVLYVSSISTICNISILQLMRMRYDTT